MSLELPRRTSGFSILELAVVLVIVSFVVGTSLIAGNMMIQTHKVLANQDRLSAARNALVLYQKKNKRYPCPAPANVASGAAGYGVEAANCAMSATCPSGVTCPALKVAAIGALPFRTLGLPEEASYDPFSHRLTYAVDKTHTLQSINGSGNIAIVDSSGGSVTQSLALGKAIFAVISHGEDSSGAYRRDGGREACPIGTVETKNCDDDNVFVDASINKATSQASNYNDDIVLWKSQDKLNSTQVMSEIPASISFLKGLGWFGPFYYSNTILSRSGHLWSAGTDYNGSTGLGVASTTVVPEYSQMAVGPAAGYTDWIGLDGGAGTGCALRKTKELWCWGNNGSGQLANGTTINSSTPTKAQIGGVRMFSTDGLVVCAITDPGKMYCWGSNSVSMLGTNYDSVPHPTPIQMGSATDWLQVSVASTAVCGIRADTKIYCWGNDYRSFGNTTTANGIVLPPSPGANGTTGWQVVSGATGYSWCGIKLESGKGALYCWGSNLSNNIPFTSTSEVLAPQLVDNTRDWKKLRLISSGGVVQDSTGTYYGWGTNNQALVDGTGTVRKTLTLMGYPMNDYVTVGGRTDTRCAIRADRSVYCWGSNTSCQINSTCSGIVAPPVLMDVN